MNKPTVLGIDLGTSALKILLIDAQANPLGSSERPIVTFHPRSGDSEQNPVDWWTALDESMREMADTFPDAMSEVVAIGLSGQMHGLVCLDDRNRILRPAIIWNDNRARIEADEAGSIPEIEAIAGLRPAPGLTACKLAWLDRNEPSLRQRLARITFCKDYLRLLMTGIHATDPCEAAGSLLFDEKRRTWSDFLLSRFGLAREMLPEVCEGPQVTGVLHSHLAMRWGLSGRPVVVAGAGDGAAGAIGIAAARSGRGFISIGTSAQISIAQDFFQPASGSGVQILAHGLPDLWYRAAALQSGASAIAWAARLAGTSVADLLAAVDHVDPTERNPVFLPYLAGERTPHDNPDARGVLFGLLADHGPGHFGRAVLRGLAFALADGYDALAPLGPMPTRLAIIGGGARSDLLCRLVASVLDTPLERIGSTKTGAALGAAFLALSSTKGHQAIFDTIPDVDAVFEPDPQLHSLLQQDLMQFRSLYAALVPQFTRIERK